MGVSLGHWFRNSGNYARRHGQAVHTLLSREETVVIGKHLRVIANQLCVGIKQRKRAPVWAVVQRRSERKGGRLGERSTGVSSVEGECKVPVNWL